MSRLFSKLIKEELLMPIAFYPKNISGVKEDCIELGSQHKNMHYSILTKHDIQLV
jgi:hypothetical protein|tara:strand:- start:110 stop:274 length:165 start_codon:yes stop_codon:yes gene_type:complete